MLVVHSQITLHIDPAGGDIRRGADRLQAPAYPSRTAASRSSLEYLRQRATPSQRSRMVRGGRVNGQARVEFALKRSRLQRPRFSPFTSDRWS
jgi:hypothetical protein